MSTALEHFVSLCDGVNYEGEIKARRGKFLASIIHKVNSTEEGYANSAWMDSLEAAASGALHGLADKFLDVASSKDKFNSLAAEVLPDALRRV